MFLRGIALCLAFGLVSTVNAQSINITMNPPGGNFNPGEVVNVDVFLTLSGATGTKLLRHVQLDVTNSHADLLATDVFPMLNGASFGFWDFDSLANCPGLCSDGHNVEAIPTGARTNIGSITYLGLTADASKQLGLVNGVAFKIGRVTLTMPNTPGDYNYSFVGTGAAPDAGARVVYGFGVLAGDDQVSLSRGAGITGGTATFTVGGMMPPVTVASSFPASGSSLWRATKNRVRITFSGIPAQNVAAGDFEIVEMLAGGGFGANVAGTFGVTQTGADVVLQDAASGLTNKKWYRVRSTSQNQKISANLCYFVQAGDADGNRIVNATDLGTVNASIPTLPAGINDGNRRRDIDGNNIINATDLGVTNAFVPGLPAAVPTGHTCP